MFCLFFFFFFNDTATTEIYTLSLHDALPICQIMPEPSAIARIPLVRAARSRCIRPPSESTRSEEHTSELQSRQYLVCRLLLEKKKKIHEDEWEKEQCGERQHEPNADAAPLRD